VAAGAAGAATERANRAAPAIEGYEVLGELGRGGMGVVYRGHQIRLNRPCVLKMILAGVHADAESVARLLAEAVARLQHPNIVQIHHIGEADGLPFFELEYVSSGSLTSQFSSRGSFHAPSGSPHSSRSCGDDNPPRLGKIFSKRF
jgi:serine/threonine protein kinase